MLGDAVSLAAERGYHIMIADPAVAPKIPLVAGERNVSIVKMTKGLRMTTMAEFAAIEAKPDHARAMRVFQGAAGVIRNLQVKVASEWVGRGRRRRSLAARDRDALRSAWTISEPSRIRRYFPAVLQEGFPEAIAHHRLRREIIATYTTNSLVNRAGSTFVHVMKEKTGLAASDIARAYAICRGVFALRELWAEIQALDNQVPAELQYDMLDATTRVAEAGTLWCLRNLPSPLNIAVHIEGFSPASPSSTAPSRS